MKKAEAIELIGKETDIFNSIQRKTAIMKELITKYAMGMKGRGILNQMGQSFNNTGKLKETVALIKSLIFKEMKAVVINGEYCTVCSDGAIGRICTDGEKVLWIEYADNEDMARKNLFPEDGDGFFIENYRDYKEIADAMMKEMK